MYTQCSVYCKLLTRSCFQSWTITDYRTTLLSGLSFNCSTTSVLKIPHPDRLGQT